MTTEVFTPGVDNLRLEVSQPVDGLPNLIENPNGDKGVWGYETPVPETQMYTDVLADGSKTMQFNNNGGYASIYFRSEFLPAVPGRYFAARYDIPQVDTRYTFTRRARLEFYNSSRTLISQSAQTALVSAVGTYYLPAYQAPAGTSFVRVRWDFYTSSGANSPGVLLSYFRKVMVTYADDANAIGSSRSNLIKNPSFETSSGLWYFDEVSNATLTRVTTQAAVGTAAMALKTVETSAIRTGMTTSRNTNQSIPVIAGEYYTLSLSFKAASTARNVYAYPTWIDETGAIVSGGTRTTPLTTLDNSSTWTRVSVSNTAPTGAKYAYINVVIGVNGNGYAGRPVANETHYVDAVLFERGDSVRPYFDGSTANTTGVTHAWTGTVHGSASTETMTAQTYEYSEPNDWLDILGPTHDIVVERKALDVGLLNATVLDAMLDPAVEPTIRPGKKVRLRAFINGVWGNIYEGQLTNAYVTYPRDKTAGSKVETRIQITASDAVAHLSNQGASSGVAKIDDLPYILEGKGVAWNVNGSGNQVANASVVSYNENASVLDQVAITRDTNLGYAWVDRDNVLKVFDKSKMGTTPVVTFSDTASPSYSDIDVDFNIESCINSVTVKWLRYDIGSATTAEITKGPYSNGQSIAQWGARAATFTIHGAVENDANIAAYAQSILAANATPVIRANSLTMPVRSESEMAIAAPMDLYTLVGVAYDNKVNTNYRVTGLTHRISTDGWWLDLSFETDGSVAQPTFIPSPPFIGVSISDVPIIKTGNDTVVISATNTLSTKVINFPTSFPSAGPVPEIFLSLMDVSHASSQMRISATGTTRDGFIVQGIRSVGTANFGFSWMAVVAP